MKRLDAFLSIVVVVRNDEKIVAPVLEKLAARLPEWVTTHEIVVVDNASGDGTVPTIEGLAGTLPDIQLYCLAGEIDRDTAAYVGIERSLGDFVVTLEPDPGQVDAVPALLAAAAEGHDIVFARSPGGVTGRGLVHRLLSGAFFRLYRLFTGVSTAELTTPVRLLSRRVVNFMMQHGSAPIMLRALPSVSGYPKTTVDLPGGAARRSPRRSLRSDAHRALGLLLSATTAPARMITSIALLAGLLNVVYAVYVVAILIFKEDVAPGWATLSLQVSGMFFLFSIILALLAEYILRIFEGALNRPAYSISRELSSPTLTRERLLSVVDRDADGQREASD